MRAISAGSAEKEDAMRAKVSGCTQTSASRKNKISPAATEAPRFLAAAGPPRTGVETIVAPAARALAAVSSVDPSSTTMHSNAGWVDRPRLRNASVSSRSALYAGITTEILGHG